MKCESCGKEITEQEAIAYGQSEEDSLVIETYYLCRICDSQVSPY